MTYSREASPSGRLLPVFGFRIQFDGSGCVAGSQAAIAATAASMVSYHQPSSSQYEPAARTDHRPRP